jgi:flagellar hook-length control protein FliK
VIRIDPLELGKVSVKLRFQGGEVRGVLEVENPKTLNQLQREAPNLIARLTEAGMMNSLSSSPWRKTKPPMN